MDGQDQGGFENKYTAEFWKNPPSQEPGTRYCGLDDDDSVPELGGSQPDQLRVWAAGAGTAAHRGAHHRHLCPLPMIVDQLAEFLKIGVVHVVEVPKISQASIPQRRLLSEPQQLVEQLVEVPVPESVLLALATDFAGVAWCQFAGTGWCMVGASFTKRDRPFGFTASPGRCTNIGQG